MRIKIAQMALNFFYIFLDLACIILCVFLAYGIYHMLGLGKEITYEPGFLLMFALFLGALVCTTMHLFGAYARESGLLNVQELRSVILGILLGLLLINALFFAVRFMPSRYLIFISFGLMLIVLPLARSVVYSFLTGRTPWTTTTNNILIYGAGKLGQQLYREIHNSPRISGRVVGFIDDDPDKWGMGITPNGFDTNHRCYILGTRGVLPLLFKSRKIDAIYIAVSNIDNSKLKELYKYCSQFPAQIAFVPQMLDIFTHRLSMEHIGNLPLIRENNNHQQNGYDRFKRIMDLGLCLASTPILLPLMGITALAVWLDSGGPVFFRQDRVGRKGRIFRMYKFRSMFQDAPRYAVNPDNSNDPRITRVGRFLRKTSLDELPQVINVLRGEMSFVGPRPEMPFIVEGYDEVHKERLQVLPGITGLWQLSGDRKKAIHENMDYDLYYIYNRSFFLDVTILIQTLIFAFRGI